MNAKLVFAALALGGAVMIGCEEKKEAAPAAPTPEEVKTTADKAAEQAKDTAAAVTEKAGEAAAAVSDEVKSALGGDPQEMLDKAMAFVKENKLDDAQAILAKLESVKGKLPAEWAGKIDSLKSAISTAKNAAGALPAMPK